MTITQITDHAEQALDAMCSWTITRPRLRAVCEIIADEVQLLEDVGFDVLTNSILSAATGVILDEYGDLFDEPRGALTDDQYRNTLRVVMAAHQADGTAKEVVYLSALLLGVAVRYIQTARAWYRLEYQIGTAISGDWEQRVKRILEIMRPVGVGYEVVEGSTDGAGTFRFDLGPGFDRGRFGRRVI